MAKHFVSTQASFWSGVCSRYGVSEQPFSNELTAIWNFVVRVLNEGSTVIYLMRLTALCFIACQLIVQV